MQTLLEQLYRGEAMDMEQSREFFAKVVNGEVDPLILSSVLTALKINGEKPSEIAGAAKALLENALAFPSPDYEFADIVGTGGDGHNTINISTTSAFVAASLGIKVAKHGNRSVSSASGSSDLLAQMGINIEMSPQTARRCLDEIGLCFLFAPQYHSGIRHAMPVRTTLKTRTIFNVLGPLINPAHPSMMVMGVYSANLLRPIAETLIELGMQKALIVHGSGLDEVCLHGKTQMIKIENGQLESLDLEPSDFGFEQYSLSDIKGGSPQENRVITDQLLKGEATDAQMSAVAANVASLLWLSGKADSLKQGAELAMQEMRSTRPYQLAQKLAELSNV
ncbi:anthranilate phosphoribosyltransferase [Alginatibacterium sediminis]|uniref:Anthranilate phosphoribosyltransferase n=1 Tax=Alginatibacterium sediminis TaxID=2164068 RepID=A0A420EI56_9ALTE|nr:anthranilate phosphoribosyltransferase [Alginatibacterium sediminis]RKF20402.1 anthranilate phosphoribosyltransferase [Alginatibacterium sediminis]